MFTVFVRSAFIAVTLLAGSLAVTAQDSTPEPAPVTAPRGGEQQSESSTRHERFDPLSRLLREIENLQAELHSTREALAACNLEATQAQRELDELRQFIADHREYGD